ncbi:hypothetical protein EON65_16360 [archaeon]|nr:MAG: hypothetical protein EON65_16360 [archaeon]
MWRRGWDDVTRSIPLIPHSTTTLVSVPNSEPTANSFPATITRSFCPVSVRDYEPSSLPDSIVSIIPSNTHSA